MQQLLELFIFDSGIIVNCFLSVIGTVEQEGSTTMRQQPHPNKPRNFLLFMLYIILRFMILNNKLLIAIFILIIIFIIYFKLFINVRKNY